MPSLKSLFGKLTGKTGFYKVNNTPERDEPIVIRKLTRSKNSTSKLRLKTNNGRKTLKRSHSFGGKRSHHKRSQHKRSQHKRSQHKRSQHKRSQHKRSGRK